MSGCFFVFLWENKILFLYFTYITYYVLYYRIETEKTKKTDSLDCRQLVGAFYKLQFYIFLYIKAGV